MADFAAFDDQRRNPPDQKHLTANPVLLIALLTWLARALHS